MNKMKILELLNSHKNRYGKFLIDKDFKQNEEVRISLNRIAEEAKIKDLDFENFCDNMLLIMKELGVKALSTIGTDDEPYHTGGDDVDIIPFEDSEGLKNKYTEDQIEKLGLRDLEINKLPEETEDESTWGSYDKVKKELSKNPESIYYLPNPDDYEIVIIEHYWG